MFYTRIILFVVLNFGALALGGLFTTKGVTGDWYLHLNKAPWTPPGWVFGAAWFTIMVGFSFFMARLFEMQGIRDRDIIILFSIQWVLNVAWNFLFFRNQMTIVALADIGLLLMVVLAFLIMVIKLHQTVEILLIAPYVIWLVIATSLNLYIVIKN